MMNHTLSPWLFTLRFSPLIISPVISSLNHIPRIVRLTALLSLGLYLSNFENIKSIASVEEHLFQAIPSELLNGIFIAMIAVSINGGLQFAANLIDTSLGLNSLNIYDPSAHISQTFTENLLSLLFIILLFTPQNVTVLLTILTQQCQHYPLGQLFKLNIISNLLSFCIQGLIIGISIALPLMSLMLCLDTTQLVINKFVPQTNTYLLMMPLKLMLGLWCFIPFIQSMLAPLISLLYEVIQ